MVVHSPVNQFSADTSLEEPRATVAGEDPVVLPRTRVPTDHADEADVLHLRSVAAPIRSPVITRPSGAVAAAVESVVGRAVRCDCCPAVANRSTRGQGLQRGAAVCLVLLMVLVQVQRVVVGVPGGHQVMMVVVGRGCCCRVRREAGGRGAALICGRRKRERGGVIHLVSGCCQVECVFLFR